MDWLLYLCIICVLHYQRCLISVWRPGAGATMQWRVSQCLEAPFSSFSIEAYGLIRALDPRLNMVIHHLQYSHRLVKHSMPYVRFLYFLKLHVKSSLRVCTHLPWKVTTISFMKLKVLPFVDLCPACPACPSDMLTDGKKNKKQIKLGYYKTHVSTIEEEIAWTCQATQVEIFHGNVWWLNLQF